MSTDARACTACGHEAARVRCLRCFSLVAASGAECSHCGGALELEAELGPGPMSCPRCAHGLFDLQAGDVSLAECKSCGGVFLDHQALTFVISPHRPAENHVARVQTPALPPPEASVRYLPCPVCTSPMNRAIFGRKSGVVVDVCKVHGTWFDARELTACVAFVEQGGLERAEKQALAERREALRRAQIDRRTAAIHDALNPPAHSSRLGDFVDPPMVARSEAFVDLLSVLLGK